jgi:hypothetical protein
LNRRFFIDAKYSSMLRRIQIEADDIGGFTFEVRIVAYHVAIQPMRFQSGLLPPPMHHVFAHPDGRSQLAAAPMSGPVLRLSARRRQNFCPQCGREDYAGCPG